MVSMSHCRLSTATFCSRASRFRNTSAHAWLADGVLIVLSIVVRPRDRHVQHWKASEQAGTKINTASSDTTTLHSACMVSISHARFSLSRFVIARVVFVTLWNISGSRVAYSVLIALNIGGCGQDTAMCNIGEQVTKHVPKQLQQSGTTALPVLAW